MDFLSWQSSDVTKGILLPDLSANNQHLLDTGQLFHGHTKFHRVFQTRNQVQLRDFVLRHVSAHGLHSFIVPSSLKQHSNMLPQDKLIWDEAYNEEYDGLASIPT
jgi:hypothetical protein